jgi:hypothetical protein
LQAKQDKEEKDRERMEVERLFRLLDEGYITTGELKNTYKVHPTALGSRKYAFLCEMWRAKGGKQSRVSVACKTANFPVIFTWKLALHP